MENVNVPGKKLAIVIISGSDQILKVISGLHIANRVHEVKQDNGIDATEVFFFAGGSKLLVAIPDEVNQILQKVMLNGITVKACKNEAKAWGFEEQAKNLGIQLEFARDAFSRYVREGYTVFTF